MRWERVEQLAARAPDPSDLRFHRLELVAARRLRDAGEEPAPQLGDAERLAALVALAAPVVLGRARAAYGGRMALFKGPELAARYPDPALRPYRDLDLLVDDAPAAQEALLAAGFAPTGLWADDLELHHLQPLCWPGLPLGVELHSGANVPAGLRAPSTRELLDGARPGRFAGGIVDAPAPAAHALLVAAHAWAHAPLGHLGQLVDTALLADEAGEEQVAELARRWGWERLWRTTRSAIGVVLEHGGRPPVAIRVCAPHLAAARERTLLERHVEELASPFFGLPAPRAATVAASVLARRILPSEEETWARKLRRARRALGNRRLAHSEHERRLAPSDLHVGAPRGLHPATSPEHVGAPRAPHPAPAPEPEAPR